MRNRKTIFFLWAFVLLHIVASGMQAAVAGPNPSLGHILAGMEKRYTNSKISARFIQESTIKAMEITDFASGKVYLKHPGMMRWEYEKPDRQIIITDGFKLWIYRPEDNQVMTGSAPEFFRDGRGASFLSDIKIIRDKFAIELLDAENNLFYELKLQPLEKTMDVTDVRLSVSKKNFTIVRVVTYNFYGDETRIEFLNLKFDVQLDDDLFSFEIPEGVDVLQIDE